MRTYSSLNSILCNGEKSETTYIVHNRKRSSTFHNSYVAAKKIDDRCNIEKCLEVYEWKKQDIDLNAYY